MTNSRRVPRSIQRRTTAKKAPKIKIVAYCEGKNTEPDFLLQFSLSRGNGLVDIQPIRAAGVPLTLVRKAVEHKKQLDKTARKSKDPLDKKFQVWALFDRDAHPNIPQAFDMAHGNGVHVAYSNPCFELWPMLHFRSQTAPIHRHHLQRALENEIAGYDSNGSKKVNLETLRDDYNAAKARAISLRQSNLQTGDEMANPYTDVYELFDVIIENGKPA
ncbi:RloB family protein [Vibrio fluvialis]